MDKIDQHHLNMLKHGGNRKFLEFLNLYQISNNSDSRDTKYVTKAVEYYRKLLSNAAVTGKKFSISEKLFNKLSLEDG